MNSTLNIEADVDFVKTEDKSIVTKRLPGDLAMWFFILAELTVFAILFIGFAVSEQLNTEMFSQGKAKLHQISGLINTLTLITSSYFVALALNKMHQGLGKQSARLLLIAKLIASIYIGVKIWEYWLLGSAGYGLHGDHFFMAYFLLTGFHLLHVLLGIVILGIMARKLRRAAYGPEDVVGLESGALYWHMVDLIWIVLFPIVYVIQ